MKKHALLWTNVLVCLIILVGFLVTAVVSYRSNIGVFEKDIEQVSTLATEGIHSRIASLFSRPVSVSLTMANDHLLKTFLSDETRRLNDPAYIANMRDYLDGYREKYQYDSVFLVSSQTKHYYHYSGLNRTLASDNPENTWYYAFVRNPEEYELNIDNDEATDDSITVFVNGKIRDNDGTTLGVVGVGFKVDFLQKLLAAYDEQFGVKATLVDSSGMVQISSVKNGHEKVDFFVDSHLPDLRQRLLEQGEEPHTFWDTAGRQDRYIVAQYIPSLKWYLVVENDVSAVKSQFRQQILAGFFIVVCVIALVLFAITSLIKKYNAHIVKLTVSQETEYQQLLHHATEKHYENIYELDITRNRAGGETTRCYFERLGLSKDAPYDEALDIIARQQIHEKYIAGYLETFRCESVLKAYQGGINHLSYDFLCTQDGENYHWMRINAQIFFWHSDQSVRMIVYRKNIDSEKRREEGLLEEVQKDPMTGLYNKRATETLITESLFKASSGETKHAFLIFDIDLFKNINDHFGHAFGDSVISKFAAELKAQFRNDDIVGRIGGDEFVVLLKNYDRIENVRDKLDRLCAKIARKDFGQKQRFHLSASIGVSFFPEQGTSYTELYEKADQALYYSKSHGRARFTVFGEETSVVDASRVDARDMETLLHNTTDGIAKFACTEDFQLLYYNRKWVELTGLSDDVLSRSHFSGLSLVHPEDREEAVRTIGKAAENDTPFTLFFRLQRPDGQMIAVRFNGYFINERFENRYPVFYGVYTNLSPVAFPIRENVL